MYIYEGHLGSLYTSDREYDYKELYCEQCGDHDWLIGYATTKAEAWDLLRGDTDINGSGGWSYDYVMEFLNENWDDDFVPTIYHYEDRYCPECGALLEVYYDGPHSSPPEPWLIRHCDNCYCDWESELHEDGSESELQRKYWG